MRLETPGKYLVEIGHVFENESSRGYGELFVVLFQLIEGPTRGKFSWVQYPKTRFYDGGNIRHFLEVLTDQELTKELYDDVLNGAFKKTRLGLVVEKIITRKGFPFYKHEWSRS